MARARGKVIDPKGMQQAQSTWGYIQRFDGPDWPDSENWPWPLCRKKVIPFLNDGSFEIGQIVTFDIERAIVKVMIKGRIRKKKTDGELAIAYRVKPAYKKG